MSKILIAEDDPISGRVYSDILTRGGFEVELFPNGLAFMARVSEARPDAILVDMMLPGLSGIEIIKRVRATWAGKKLPIVALTNAFIPAMLEAVQLAGATTIYDKAVVTPPLLVDTFKGLLEDYSIPRSSALASAAKVKYEVSEGGWATVRMFRPGDK